MVNSSVSVTNLLSRRVVSVLDSGAEGPGFKSQQRCCRVTVLGNCSQPSCLCSPAAKLVTALLRVARVTAGLAESNGSLPPGLWLTSPAGWLPRTGISSGKLPVFSEIAGRVYGCFSCTEALFDPIQGPDFQNFKIFINLPKFVVTSSKVQNVRIPKTFLRPSSEVLKIGRKARP